MYIPECNPCNTGSNGRHPIRILYLDGHQFVALVRQPYSLRMRCPDSHMDRNLLFVGMRGSSPHGRHHRHSHLVIHLHLQDLHETV